MALTLFQDSKFKQLICFSYLSKVELFLSYAGSYDESMDYGIQTLRDPEISLMVYKNAKLREKILETLMHYASIDHNSRLTWLQFSQLRAEVIVSLKPPTVEYLLSPSEHGEPSQFIEYILEMFSSKL